MPEKDEKVSAAKMKDIVRKKPDEKEEKEAELTTKC